MTRSVRRKRKDRLTEDNHDRWLISYADFITLLFAFFVVMYSVSSVNESKYQVLSDTFNEVFGKDRVGAVGFNIQAPGESPRDIVSLPEDFPVARADEPLSEVQEDIVDQAREAIRKAASQQRVFDELAISLDKYIQNDLVEVTKNGDRIEVNINARMLFSSGDTRLSEQALDALRQIAKSLVLIPNPVQVEGHTDNVPISSRTFRSNWELSAARAATVVHFLGAQGIEPSRLAAVGMGEHRPVADNDSAEGRAANRRVVLLILGAEPEIFDPDQIIPWSEGPAVPAQ